MGARQTKAPMDIAEFRQLPSRPDHYIIPEVPEKRKTTDLKFTVILAICLGLLAIMLIYSLVHSDIRRFTSGYDTCGNVCGIKNPTVEGIPCSGGDMTNYPLLRLKVEEEEATDQKMFVTDKCVSSCENGVEIFNRCFPTTGKFDGHDAGDLLSQVANDLQRAAGYIVALCFIGLGACIVMLLLFRFCAAAVVWVILIGSLLAFVVLTGALWYLRGKTEVAEDQTGLQVMAIFFTIVTLILIILLICLFKKIKLIIKLFKESMKCVFGIPLILVEPLLTFLALAIALVMFFYCSVLLLTSGTLEPVATSLYDYSPNGAILFTIWFNVVMIIWITEFIAGCQHMVVSGAISAYYFARDKGTVVSPIYTSFYNLIRYHLGTVAFGSLIITIIAVIKALLRGLIENKHAKFIVDCCLGAIEDFLKYLSKNAYIQTAMHGQPFFKSGKRAVRLLVANALSAIAVNSVGDFVLFMAKLLIVVFTILIGVALHDPTIVHWWAVVVISALVTSILAHCFFSVFETAIDTLFICFCEDYSLNDGMARPYYMSVDFMKYVEQAKANTKQPN